MSTSEGLFWPLQPLCSQDRYVPKQDVSRDLLKGAPRLSTGKGIPFTPRFINEGEKYVTSEQYQFIRDKEDKKKRIQLNPFIVKKSPRKVCPSDASGTFSTTVYINDGKPYDWGPRTKITRCGPRQILASAPAKPRDVPVHYISDDYDRPRKAELARSAKHKSKEGPAFKVPVREVFGAHPRHAESLQNKRPQSAPARRVTRSSSGKGAFIPAGRRGRSPSVPYIVDPYDDRKRIAATTISRSLSVKMQMQESRDGKPRERGTWRPTSGQRSKYTRSIAFYK